MQLQSFYRSFVFPKIKTNDSLFFVYIIWNRYQGSGPKDVVPVAVSPVLSFKGSLSHPVIACPMSVSLYGDRLGSVVSLLLSVSHYDREH